MEEQRIIEILGSEYSPDISLEDNLVALMYMVASYKEMERINFFYIRKLTEWAEKVKEGKHGPI